jgi:hypothetical protein
MRKILDALGFVYRNQHAADKSWGSWKNHHPEATGVAILDLGGDVSLNPDWSVELVRSRSKISCATNGLYLDKSSIPHFMQLIGNAAGGLTGENVLIMEDDVRILGNLDTFRMAPIGGMIGVNRRVRLPAVVVLRLLGLGFSRALVPGYGGCGGAIVSRTMLTNFSNRDFQRTVLEIIAGVKDVWGSDEILSIAVLASKGQITRNHVFTETWRRNWRSNKFLIVHKVKTAEQDFDLELRTRV